jgi:hypothetical protein
MSSETALTGRLGKLSVDGTMVARTTQWSVNPKLANKSEWGDSDSGGYTNRAAGRFDATFSTEGKYDTSSQQFDLFMPGDIVAAILYMNTLVFWSFPRALCDDFKMTVNIDTEEVIGWSAEWGADGIFTKP